MEDRIASLYADVPGAVITHDKNISGDVYRVPHACRRVLESKLDILHNSSLLRSPRLNGSLNSPCNTFSKQLLSNRGNRSSSLMVPNHSYVRSLNSSPVGRLVPLSTEASKYNSLPLGAKQRGHTSGQPYGRGYNSKFSFDETSSSNSWHSSSYSHTHNHVIHEDCLAEIRFPDSYEPNNRMLKLAASMENLELKEQRGTNHFNQSKWQQLSSADTSDISEVLSQSNYSPSPYSSSTGHSNHGSSLHNQKLQRNADIELSFTAGHHKGDARGIRSLLEETERLRAINSRQTGQYNSVLSQEPKGGRGGRVTFGKNQYSVPRGFGDQLTNGVPDSEHVYSIPNLHSRSMDLLNPGVSQPAASSTNTSSSEYYEPMNCSVVRHRPKLMSTNRMGKSRAVRKSVNKRDNPHCNSSISSFTSESSGSSSAGTDDGVILESKRVYF